MAVFVATNSRQRAGAEERRVGNTGEVAIDDAGRDPVVPIWFVATRRSSPER